MKQLRIDEIRTIGRGWRLSEGIDVMVTGVSIDSRTATHGDLFVAVRGDRFDGHDFLSQAARAGCVAAIVHRDTKLSPELIAAMPGGFIGVNNTIDALADLASAQRKSFGGSVVAVTGSNGKTTAKMMLDHILSTTLDGFASEKSYNNEIGVPLTLLRLSGSEDYVICEVGTNNPGEIAKLGRIISPDLAVVTSISDAHLENFKTLDKIAGEKASILGCFKSHGLGILCGDSDLFLRASRAYDCRTVSFGQSDQCQLRLTDYKPTAVGCSFELNSHCWVDLPLPGKHNAMNAIAAIAASQKFGFTQEQAAEVLKDFHAPAMRLERLTLGAITVINDAYNANPASMLAGADVLAEVSNGAARGRGRKVMIVGDMLELGEAGPSLARDVGAEIASKEIDMVIGIGQLGAIIADEAGKHGAASHQFTSNDVDGGEVSNLIDAGDVVLIKASRGVALDRLVADLQSRFAPVDTDALEGELV